MRALSRERLPKIVTRAGFGVVMVAAISVAVVAETTSSSSAGGGHASLLAHKVHQRLFPLRGLHRRNGRFAIERR